VRLASGQVGRFGSEGELARVRGNIDVACIANDGVGGNRDLLVGRKRDIGITV